MELFSNTIAADAETSEITVVPNTLIGIVSDQHVTVLVRNPAATGADEWQDLVLIRTGSFVSPGATIKLFAKSGAAKVTVHGDS